MIKSHSSAGFRSPDTNEKKNRETFRKPVRSAVVFLTLCAFLLSVSAASASTWTVGEGGDFPGLPDAVSSSSVSAGDTILVSAGEYAFSANVSINRTLTIEGTGPETIFNMNNFSFLLKGDSVTFRNLTVRNTSYGINTQSGGTNACIENCIFEDVHHADGIKLAQTGAVFRNNIIRGTTFTSAVSVFADDAVISGNTISGNTGSGTAARVICIKNASGITVTDNTISGNSGEGIRLWGPLTSDILITGNTITGNGKGIVFNSTGPDIRIWFNDIHGNTADVTGAPASEALWSSPDQISYTYNGNVFTSKIGNYHGNAYSGADSDGNGIGDTPFAFLNGSCEDAFPLVASVSSYIPGETVVPGNGGDGGNGGNGSEGGNGGNGGNGSEGGNGGSDPGNSRDAGEAVSLNATILPLIEFTISANAVDFGAVRPGRDSEPQTITVSNTGSGDITITAEVTETSDAVYKTGLFINDDLWSAFSRIVGADASEELALVLSVPRNYAGTSSPSGQVVFWAEVSE